MTADSRLTSRRLALTIAPAAVPLLASFVIPRFPVVLVVMVLMAAVVMGWRMRLPAAAIVGAAVALAVAAIVPAMRALDLAAVFAVGTAVGAATAATMKQTVERIRTGQFPPSEFAPPLLDRAPDSRRRSIGTLAMYVGLPLLAAIIYLNLSDLIARRTPIPSILQPLILVLLIAVIMYRDFLRPRAVLATTLVFCVGLWGLLLLIRSVWASDVGSADARIAEVVRGLIILILAATLAATWKALRAALTVLAFCAALLAALTIFQTLTGQWQFDFGGLARSEEAHIYGEVSDRRPGGPVGDPNFYGQILLMTIPLAIFLGWHDADRKRRLLLLGAGAVTTIGTLLTYSRGATLALAFVLLLTMLALRIPIRYAVAAAVIGFLLLPANLTRRLLPFSTEEGVIPGVRVDTSLEGRKLDAATALLMFDDHVLFGAGTGSFADHYHRYANRIGSSAPYYERAAQVPHSLYLEIAAETGLLGLLTFGLAMAAAFFGLDTARRRLIAAGMHNHAAIATGLSVALAGFLVSSIFLHGAFQRYLWLLLGLVAAVIRLSSRETLPDAAREAAA